MTTCYFILIPLMTRIEMLCNTYFCIINHFVFPKCSSDTEDEAAAVVPQQCQEFLKWCNLQNYPFHLLELLDFG